MALNDLGIEVPAGSDPFDPQGDMVQLGASLEGRVIVPVANDAARNALATLLSPTTSLPLFVAYPSGLIQSTTDGSTWRVVTMPAVTSTITPTANWTGTLDYSVSHGGTITIGGSLTRSGTATAPVTASVVAAGGIPANLRPWVPIYGRVYTTNNARTYHASINTDGSITMLVTATAGDLTTATTNQFSFPAYPVAP